MTFWLMIPFVLAQCADVWTTVTNLSLGCDELNPLYQGSTLHILTVKSTVTTGIGILVWWLHGRGCTQHANLILWTGIIAACSAATWNFWLMPYCGR